MRYEVNTLILWESVGNGRRFGDGLVSSHIPKLPHYSHVQSHAAISKIICVIPTLSAPRRSCLQVAGLDPFLSLTNVRFEADDLGVRPPVTGNADAIARGVMCYPLRVALA
jgi:hypothetical protein